MTQQPPKTAESIRPATLEDFDLVKRLDAESYPDDVWINDIEDYKKVLDKKNTVVGFGDSYLQHGSFPTRGNYLVSLGGPHSKEMLEYFLSLPSDTGRYYTHTFPSNTGKTDWEGKAKLLADHGFSDIGFGDGGREEVPFAYDLKQLKEHELLKGGEIKSAVVKQEGDEWLLYTKDGKRVLGRHKTAQDAYKQEYAIQKSQEKKASWEVAEQPGMNDATGMTEKIAGLQHSVLDSPTPVEGLEYGDSDGVPYVRELKPGALLSQLGRQPTKTTEFWNDDPYELDEPPTESDTAGEEELIDFLENNGTLVVRYGEKAPWDVVTPNEPAAASITKSASVAINPAFTGPMALKAALAKLDLAKLEEQHRAAVNGGNAGKRADAIKALNVIEGLKKNNVRPDQLMITKVPIIPPVFRPFSIAGNTFVPGDANELYKDMYNMREAYKEAASVMGDHHTQEEKLGLYDSVKAVYGYGDPVNPKTLQRGVSGFMKTISGTNPKFSFVQRKLISKPQDSVARGVISVDPELNMDEIGVPEDAAWTMYSPYIQRRLVRAGIGGKFALQHLKDRTPYARKMLEQEMENRYIMYSRAPSWHKFNVLAGKGKIIEGDVIKINPLITTGQNADFDGDTMNLHVPSSPAAVKEAKDKLLPSRMLFSIRNQDKVVPTLKHEQVLGLFAANARPAKAVHRFPNEAAALKAIETGAISLSDDVEIG